MKKPKRKPIVKSYTIMNSSDGNDTFTVEATTAANAAFAALDELGWDVYGPEPLDEEKDQN